MRLFARLLQFCQTRKLSEADILAFLWPGFVTSHSDNCYLAIANAAQQSVARFLRMNLGERFTKRILPKTCSTKKKGKDSNGSEREYTTGEDR